jgi:hypothetical protein
LPFALANVKAQLIALSLSVPAAAALLIGAPSPARWLLWLLFVLSIPWVVPAFTLLAVLSVPPYMWLHRHGAPPDLATWLGGVLLAGAVVGLHVNAVLAAARWLAPRRDHADDGLGSFLRRTPTPRRSPPAR